MAGGRGPGAALPPVTAQCLPGLPWWWPRLAARWQVRSLLLDSGPLGWGLGQAGRAKGPVGHPLSLLHRRPCYC